MTVPLPALPRAHFTHRVADSEFRGFVVELAERSALVAVLRSPAFVASVGHEGTLHHSGLPPGAATGTPCFHVPAAGGGEAPDDDGEPGAARVGDTLLEEVPAGMAMVVWRRFGGAFLGVSSGALQEAYRQTAREAVARFRVVNSDAWRAFRLGIAMRGEPLVDAAWRSREEELHRHWKVDLCPRLLPLPVPCGYCWQGFLDLAGADRMLEALERGVRWEAPAAGSKEERSTALYGEVQYGNRDGKGYTAALRAWSEAPPELTELKDRVEAWHLERTGVPVSFNVCLLNHYNGGVENLAWHADREEIDPAQDAPRISPIASVSLGTPRLFGFCPKETSEESRRTAASVRAAAADLASPDASRRNSAADELQALGWPPVRLAHGSLCVMENVCQFLYKHALLPEHGIQGVRINVTFRAKRGVPLALEPPPNVLEAGWAPHPTSAAPEGAANVGAGLPSAEQRREQGWKDKLQHPFESPFIDDAPAVAVARYQAWLMAQPAFLHWVRGELLGRPLTCNTHDEHDVAHARLLAANAAAGRLLAAAAVSAGPLAPHARL